MLHYIKHFFNSICLQFFMYIHQLKNPYCCIFKSIFSLIIYNKQNLEKITSFQLKLLLGCNDVTIKVHTYHTKCITKLSNQTNESLIPSNIFSKYSLMWLFLNLVSSSCFPYRFKQNIYHLFINTSRIFFFILKFNFPQGSLL